MALDSTVTHFIASGPTRKYGRGSLEFVKCKGGWQQRPCTGDATQGMIDCLKCDYVSNETPEELLGWLFVDFRYHDIRILARDTGDDDEEEAAM